MRQRSPHAVAGTHNTAAAQRPFSDSNVTTTFYARLPPETTQ